MGDGARRATSGRQVAAGRGLASELPWAGPCSPPYEAWLMRPGISNADVGSIVM